MWATTLGSQCAHAHTYIPDEEEEEELQSLEEAGVNRVFIRKTSLASS